MDLLSSLRANIIELPQSIILPAVFFVALLSSLHCVGMCGVFCLASSAEKKSLSWLYHIGRLASYMLLGALFAIIGEQLVYELQPYLLGLVLFILVVVLLLKSKWLNFAYKKMNLPNYYLLQKSKNLPIKMKALLLGLSSGLLPCGLLYTFLFAALAVQEFWLGMGIILMFWLGTSPALQVLVYFQSRFSFIGRLRSSKWNYLVIGFFIIYALAISTHRLEKLPVKSGQEIMMCI